MKQEILCPKCAVEMRRKFPTSTPYPGEHVKFVDGALRHGALCDGCSPCAVLKTGDEVTCFSIWADYGGVPYYPWEHEFIEEPEA